MITKTGVSGEGEAVKGTPGCVVRTALQTLAAAFAAAFGCSGGFRLGETVNKVMGWRCLEGQLVANSTAQHSKATENKLKCTRDGG